ncbi:hypothetical protein [Streptomyces sp. NPDC023838]|uniref:hypothetical protein n=1 Tax=Streptomyces sp. NPDC023838 TaxID=3154325 RepID=UPI0033CFDEA5
MRRAALIGISAAATLALGGTLAACGGEGGKPYVAVGTEAPSSKAVPPHGKVELVPLDGAGATAGDGSNAAGRDGKVRSPSPSGTKAHSNGGTGGASGGTAANGAGSAAGGGGPTASGTAQGGTGTPGSTGDTPGGGATTGGGTGTPGGGSATGGSTTGGSPSGGGTGTDGGTGGGTTTPSPTPAALTLGTPARTPTPTPTRWCENVTLPLHNTGGTPTKPGTLTFATHIIGLLGVDWATITSTQPLAPVAARTATARTYTVCVDSWRVPLGMHIETRSVTADWR